MTQDERDKIAHESLLREMQHADNEAETHARTVILIIVGLLAFVSHFAFVSENRSVLATYIASSVGIVVSLELLLKLWRQRAIVRDCHNKLTRVEKRIGIKAIRQFPVEGKLAFEGFSITICLAILFILAFGAIIALAAMGY